MTYINNVPPWDYVQRAVSGALHRMQSRRYTHFPHSRTRAIFCETAVRYGHRSILPAKIRLQTLRTERERDQSIAHTLTHCEKGRIVSSNCARVAGAKETRRHL